MEFKLSRPKLRGVLTQYALACRRSNLLSTLRRQRECTTHIIRRFGNYNLFGGSEEVCQPAPPVRDDGGAACCRLEKPYTRAMAGLHHVSARHIESPSNTRIELWMVGWGEVGDVGDIGWPADRRRILRSCHHEAQRGHLLGRLQ